MKVTDVVTALLCLQITSVSTQIGRECSRTEACMPNQTCHYGRCTCNRGYVRNDRNCFPARKYGEACFFDIQCIDHRMACRLDNSTLPAVRVCVCHGYYTLNSDTGECIESMNLTAILTTLEESNTLELLEKEAHGIFLWIVIAGLAVAGVLAVIAVTCIIYGCCLYECYDWCTKDDKDVEKGPMESPPANCKKKDDPEK